MHYRSGGFVKGYMRNGSWINRHYRNSTTVSGYIRSNHLSQNSYSELDSKYNYDLYSYRALKPFYYHTFNSSVISRKHEIIKLEHVDKVYTTFFIDESYKSIIQEILQVIKTFAPTIKEKYLENKNEEEFKVFLNSYIEEYIEDKLLEINLIKKYFHNYNDIVLISMALYLMAFEPKLYGMEFFENTVQNEKKNYLSREEIIKQMKKIIADNQKYLQLHHRKQNWDYIRTQFFREKIEKILKNPKIAIHMLFKKICEDELDTWVKGQLTLPIKEPYPRYINNSRPKSKYDYYGFDDFLYHFKTHSPYDENGFNVYGIHKETGTCFNHEGLNRSGVSKNYVVCTDGYDACGYDINGYDQFGFNIKGIHIETKKRLNPDGHTKRDVLNVLPFLTISESKNI